MGNEILQEVNALYGTGCMSKTRVYKWRNMFLCGRTNLADEEWSGRPSDSTSAFENMQQIHDLFEKNRRMSTPKWKWRWEIKTHRKSVSNFMLIGTLGVVLWRSSHYFWNAPRTFQDQYNHGTIYFHKIYWCEGMRAALCQPMVGYMPPQLSFISFFIAFSFAMVCSFTSLTRQHTSLDWFPSSSSIFMKSPV